MEEEEEEEDIPRFSTAKYPKVFLAKLNHAKVGRMTTEERDHEIAKRLQYLRANSPQTVYVFVLLTDGQDTIHNEVAIDEILDRNGKRLVGAGARCVMKVVTVSKNASTEFVARAKKLTDTMSMWETSFLHFAPRFSMLSMVVRELCDDLKHLRKGFALNIAIPHAAEIL